MSRHHKTFAPRTSWFEAQKLDNEEAEKKYEEISSQDATITLAKNEVTQLTHDLFNNRAFNKIEKKQSVMQFSNQGLHVQTLNKALNELGYKTQKNEKLFWNETKSQLMNFQRDYGVKASGIFDRKTLLKMDEVLEKAGDEEKEKKTKKSNNILSSQLEKAKVNNREGSDTITNPITIAKNQKFNGKIIQTDEELNRFAEYKMGITRKLTWKPSYTKEQVKNIIDKGGTVNYTISAKTHSIEKETETLSPDKKQFIRNAASSVDYIQNIRILDLLQQLSDDEIADYKNKVTEETNDLKTIEESLKEYIKNRNLRNKEKTTREKLQNQLSKPELSDLYKQYTNFIKFKHSHENTFYEPKDPNKVYFQNALDKQLQDLLASLKANGFTLESFKKLIKDYEIAFRKETVHIAEDSLIRYKHILFEQKKKLLEDTFLINLLEKIKTSRAEESYDESDKATPHFYDNKLSAAEREFKMKMEERARSKKAEGNAAIENLSSTTPLVKDNGFNKEGFAKVESKQELRGFLESYINDQEGNITKIIAKLQSNQGLSIYGFASLLQKSKEQQGIAKDSIFDLIVSDKEDEESTKHIIEGLLIGVLAVALGLLSFGTGTVAVLLAAGNFALGAYITYEEIEAYRTQLAAYKVNISDDEPNAVWVIIGVVGSVLDVAAVAKISKTLIKAGRTFEETKDIVQTRKILDNAKLDVTTKEKIIKALEEDLVRIEALEYKIQQNTVKQTELKVEIKESLDRTKKDLFTINIGINPKNLPRLIQLARQYIQKGTLSFEKFLLQIQKIKMIKEIEKLSPEELSLLRKAFEDAIEIQKVKDALKIEFLDKIGKRLPGNWDEFSPHTNIEFAEELKKYRGDYDLTFDRNFRGSEGQLFDIYSIENKTLKRWFENRLDVMPKSIRLLDEAKNIVDSTPLLRQYVEVVEVMERGPDWIVRGFDESSVKITEVLSDPLVMKAKKNAIELLSKEQAEIAQDILKKINKNSANIHWSLKNKKILIIDML